MAIARILAPAFLALCAACQTPPTMPTEDVLLRSAEAEIYAPILLSRNDVLTAGTLAQVIDHNNVYWCRHKEKRPESFDPAVCDPK